LVVAFVQIAGFRAAVLYRVGNRNWKKGNRIRAAICTRLIRATCHMDIEISAEIGPGICFPHTWSIVIGGLSKIGSNCRIMQCVSLGGAAGKKKPDGQSQPYLGNRVLVGAGAKIIGPVTVGDDAKIGANAVVLDDVPACASAVGVPAKIVGVCSTQ
jgi:serine O-acetyltransferase